MKIYMVQAHNGMRYEDYRWWNMRAFTSLETAQKFLENINDAYEVVETRKRGLKKILNIRGELTKDEQRELIELDDMWYWWWPGRSEAWIKEIEVYD